LIGQDHPSVLVDATSLLVHVETLGRLHKLWLLIMVVKVSHNVVGVEVVLFKVEWSWNLSTIIQFILREHLLEVLVLKNGARFWITEVTSMSDSISILVLNHTIRILWHNNVSVFVSVDLAHDIILVESAQIGSWWHINWPVTTISKVVHESVSHLDRLVHTRQLWAQCFIRACVSLCLRLEFLLLLSLRIFLFFLHLGVLVVLSILSRLSLQLVSNICFSLLLVLLELVLVCFIVLLLLESGSGRFLLLACSFSLLVLSSSSC